MEWRTKWNSPRMSWRQHWKFEWQFALLFSFVFPKHSYIFQIHGSPFGRLLRAFIHSHRFALYRVKLTQPTFKRNNCSRIHNKNKSTFFSHTEFGSEFFPAASNALFWFIDARLRLWIVWRNRNASESVYICIPCVRYCDCVTRIHQHLHKSKIIEILRSICAYFADLVVHFE